jgi:hypothetical protein
VCVLVFLRWGGMQAVWPIPNGRTHRLELTLQGWCGAHMPLWAVWVEVCAWVVCRHCSILACDAEPELRCAGDL